MNEIIIVSGLPRSGTSMMMKMLEAGGMNVVTDNLREADEDNPKGYYEFERVKSIREDVSWLDEVRGKVVKMVSMLLFELPGEQTYKLIFMRRAMDEILASQRKMLERKGDHRNYSDEEMGILYRKHLDEIGRWVESQRHIDLLNVDYKEVMEDPRRIAGRISAFLERGLDVEAMAQVVDHSLYRQRGTEGGVNDSGRSLPEAGESEQEREKIEEQLKSLGYM